MNDERIRMIIIVDIFLIILEFFFIIIPILISIAYLTLLERKLLGFSQLRKGPNIVGLYGLLQPLADGIKLFSKEIIIPSHSNIFLFIIAPIISLTMGFIPWFIFPWGNYKYGMSLDHEYSLLFLLAILSIGIFGVILSGWSSNSKYAFLGSIRAVAQMISYEISLSLILMNIILISNSLNLSYIFLIQYFLNWLLIPLLPLGIIFFISLLAETNRAPFDLSEGESELVSGYNVEYSSMTFAFFFLAEYSHIILSSFIFSILFLGNKINFFDIYYLNYIINIINICMKGSFLCCIFIWVRTSFPRLRYDQVMNLCWKQYLPLSISLLWLINCILWGFNL